MIRTQEGAHNISRRGGLREEVLELEARRVLLL